jgi:hypothetical protein
MKAALIRVSGFGLEKVKVTNAFYSSGEEITLVWMATEIYNIMNKAWKSTCKVLFGQEAGELEDCADWLREYEEELRIEKSAISGKEVTLSANDYAKGAHVAAYDEIDFGKRFAPLSINEMKDIDSIAQAISDRAFYAGDMILGNSSHVQNSSGVIDSHFVLDSTIVNDSKYIGYSRYVGLSEYCFGLYGAEKDIHVVKCMGSELKRCFECHMVEVLADCYYCAKSQNCQNCMFCFGTRNKSNMIGNTELPKDNYLALKGKLLSEMAQELKKNGRVFSLLALIEKTGKYAPDARLKFKQEKEKAFNIAPLEKAFENTTSLLFGKSLSGIDSYDSFLQKHVPKNITTKSPFSGTDVITCGYRTHLSKLYSIGKRIASEQEMIDIGEFGIEANDAERLEFDLETAAGILHPVAYTNMDKVAGQVINCLDASVAIDCQDCMHGSAFIWSKKCSHCFWTSNAEAVFGGNVVRNSSFCLKCHFSKKMMRSFECDSCEGCSDGYFLYNCENVRDSMFCFNSKNLTNAIGNAALEVETYKKVKSSLVSQMADELEKKKDLKWDIYNIGCR